MSIEKDIEVLKKADLKEQSPTRGWITESLFKIIDKLQAKRDEYHDQYHLCEVKLLSHKSIIRQLQAELDKHHWIPVSESPVPKDGKEYLVCNLNQGRVLTLIYWSAVYERWMTKGEAMLSMQATHWKPITLPEQEAL